MKTKSITIALFFCMAMATAYLLNELQKSEAKAANYELLYKLSE